VERGHRDLTGWIWAVGRVDPDQGDGVWRALSGLLLIHELARTLQLALVLDTPAAEWRFGLALAVLGCLVLWRWRPALACGLTALAVGVQVIWCFPFVANHLFVEALALALVAVAGPERPLGIAGCRWVAVAVLGWSGLQKLLHGTWVQGSFLASAIAMEEGFAQAFAWLLPSGEVAALVARGQPAPGSGEWALGSAAGLAISNGTWLAEILLAALLLKRRTRRWASWAAVALILGVQLGARELFFAGLMTVLLLSFQRAAWLRRLVPVLVVLDAALIASLAGWLPAWTFN